MVAVDVDAKKYYKNLTKPKEMRTIHTCIRREAEMQTQQEAKHLQLSY
jgi:hypothetical protein